MSGPAGPVVGATPKKAKLNRRSSVVTGPASVPVSHGAAADVSLASITSMDHISLGASVTHVVGAFPLVAPGGVIVSPPPAPGEVPTKKTNCTTAKHGTPEEL